MYTVLQQTVHEYCQNAKGEYGYHNVLVSISRDSNTSGEYTIVVDEQGIKVTEAQLAMIGKLIDCLEKLS